MTLGPIGQLIAEEGKEYDVLTASDAEGRDIPSYSSAGTLMGVLERRGRPRTVTTSAGEEVDVDTEIRTTNENDISIMPTGTRDSHPAKLKHPNGTEYRVVDTHPEDGAVTVISVVRD